MKCSQITKRRWIDFLTIVAFLGLALLISYLFVSRSLPSIPFIEPYHASGISESQESCAEYNVSINLQTQSPIDIQITLQEQDQLTKNISAGIRPYPDKMKPLILNKSIRVARIQATDRFTIYFQNCRLLEGPENVTLNNKMHIELKTPLTYGYGAVTFWGVFIGIFALLFQSYKYIFREFKSK